MLRAWNGGSDVISAPATLSSNVTLDNRGVITRTYTSLKAAAEENAASRVFGGVSVVSSLDNARGCFVLTAMGADPLYFCWRRGYRVGRADCRGDAGEV